MKVEAFTTSTHCWARLSRHSFFLQWMNMRQPPVSTQLSPMRPRYSETQPEAVKERKEAADWQIWVGPEAFLNPLLNLPHSSIHSLPPSWRTYLIILLLVKPRTAGSQRVQVNLSEIRETKSRGNMTCWNTLRPSGSQSRTHPVPQADKTDLEGEALKEPLEKGTSLSLLLGHNMGSAF